MGTRLLLPAVGAPDSPCLRLHLSIPACFFTWPPLLCLCVLSSHENMSRWIYLKKKHSNFTYLLYVAALGLCCRAGFSLVSENRGYSLVVLHRLLIAVASFAAEHGL